MRTSRKASKDVEEEIGTAEIFPVYGIFGADPFRREDAVRRLRDRVLSGRGEIHYESYTGGEGLRDVLTAAETLPFGGGKKLVVARDCEKIPDEELFLLERYLERPNPSTVLVLDGAKPPGKRVAPLVKKTGKLVEAAPLKSGQVPDWLVRRAREQGIRLERDAALMIADRVGSDLALAQQELEKVITYSAKRVIRREEVADTLSSGGGGEIWTLFDRIGERDLAGAFAALAQLISQGDHPVKIVSQLAGRLRKLHAFRSLLDRGTDAAEAGSSLGVRHPYALKCFIRESKAYAEEEIRRGISRLSEVDHKLKQTQLPGRILLEMFLVGLVSGRRNPIRRITSPSPISGSDGRSSGKPYAGE